MPPGSNKEKSNRPITERIEGLRLKITLLEGDRKAYFENSQFAMKKNRETIQKHRKENKELRQKLNDSLSQDEHVINKAFRDKPVERVSMKNKTGRQAITIMDHKVCDAIKKVNSLRHQTAMKQKRVDELQTQYDQMEKDSENAASTDKGQSDDAQNMRTLENNHDKAQLKIDEAMQIKRIYEQIKHKLEDEALKFPNQLDSMETDIQQCRVELKDLKAMHDDAQISKDAAQAELHKHEEIVYRDRKNREIELQRMKKEAEEKKMQHDKIERRINQRTTLPEEVASSENKALTGEEQQQKITSYEEAFKRIKEATGVSDTWEVVHRFENQEETAEHLQSLQKDNEKTIVRLREDKEKMQQDFEDMKYSGDAKLSSGQRYLEEYEVHLDEEETRRDDAEFELQRSSKTLVAVKAGVNHLCDKLHNIKATKGHVPQAQISPTSDEYVLDQLATSEEKLLKLLEELDGKNLEELLQQMDEEEFHSNMEGKLPAYNTRVKLPQLPKESNYDDEEESGEDDIDVMTRHMIKKQSQQLMDSKNKRRQTKRKKKSK